MQEASRAAAHDGRDCGAQEHVGQGGAAQQHRPITQANAGRARRTRSDGEAQSEHAAHVEEEPYARRLDQWRHNLSFDPFGGVDAQRATAAAEGKGVRRCSGMEGV